MTYSHGGVGVWWGWIRGCLPCLLRVFTWRGRGCLPCLLWVFTWGVGDVVRAYYGYSHGGGRGCLPCLPRKQLFFPCFPCSQKGHGVTGHEISSDGTRKLLGPNVNRSFLRAAGCTARQQTARGNNLGPLTGPEPSFLLQKETRPLIRCGTLGGCPRDGASSCPQGRRSL